MQNARVGPVTAHVPWSSAVPESATPTDHVDAVVPGRNGDGPGQAPPVSAAPPAATRAMLDDHSPVTGERRLFNRELSWLAFNERVLALATRDDVPLLERTKFLAIFTSNLDEFFQVRVSGLMEQVAAGLTRETADGMRPSEQLAAIRQYVVELMDDQTSIFHDRLVPQLAAEGVRFSNWSTLDDDDRAWLVEEFEERVFPVLTPLAVDPAHPFPYISNLSLNLAVVVRDPADGETRFARVKVPPILPRFVVMPAGERFVPLEQVIAAHLGRLFPGLDVIDHHAFRVTRNADFEVEEDEADDLMLAIESELNRRRFGRVVRLEVEPDMPDAVLELLSRELQITPEQVYRVPGPLGLDGLTSLHDVARADLKYDTFVPVVPPRLVTLSGDEADVFAALRRGDVLVHHPYDAFGSSVQHFIRSTRPAWPSRSPCTAPRGRARPWCVRWSRPRSWASRSSPWSSSRPGSTRRPTSSGRGCWRRWESTSRTGSSVSRPTPRSPWSSARRATACAGTSTSAPATTTTARPASTRTWGFCPPIRRWGPTSPTCSTC